MALEDSLLVRINSLQKFTCCGKSMAEPERTVSLEDVIFYRTRRKSSPRGRLDGGFRRAKDLILAYLWTVVAASRGICAELTERETGDGWGQREWRSPKISFSTFPHRAASCLLSVLWLPCFTLYWLALPSHSVTSVIFTSGLWASNILKPWVALLRREML